MCLPEPQQFQEIDEHRAVGDAIGIGNFANEMSALYVGGGD
jgi:hypothetical protein